MKPEKQSKWYHFKKGELSSEFKRQFSLYFFTILLAGIVLVIVLNIGNILSFITWIWNAIRPLVIGAGIAFIINLIMQWYNKKVFTEKWIRNPKLRGILSLSASLVTIIVVLALVLVLVLPQLVSSADLLVRELPANYQKFEDWVKKISQNISPEFSSIIDRFRGESGNLMNTIGHYFNSAVTNVAQSTYSIASNTMSGFFSLIMSIIFAVYLLIFKGKIYHQAREICYTYLPEKGANRLLYFFHLANVCFSNYVYSELISVISLFILYVISSFILQLPYTLMIGTVVGITSLIPLFGIYIGWAIGGILILTVSPIKALIFTILVFVLFQIQSNIIGPRIVGNTIGLPPVWVLATVIVGGNMFGIPGMLLSIPIVATFYELIKEDARIRLKDKPQKVEEINHPSSWKDYNVQTGTFEKPGTPKTVEEAVPEQFLDIDKGEKKKTK